MEPENNRTADDAPAWPLALSGAEIDALMAVASDTVAWCADGYDGAFTYDRYEDTPYLAAHYASFVTLRQAGALRGCMGTIDAVAPLRVSVHQNAANAATRDPRFSPVSREALSEIDISISVLSPLRHISTLNEFKVGEHGLLLQKGPHRGVFLPEVALEQGWDRETTFNALCQKAGAPEPLDPGACTLSVFECLSIVGLRDPDDAPST